MTPEEALEEAKQIVLKNSDDGCYFPEKGHPDIDDLFCDVLRSLGYSELVDYYLEQERWFE